MFINWEFGIDMEVELIKVEIKIEDIWRINVEWSVGFWRIWNDI